ncbi:MAG: tetratricopeptide repeat protein, partial [Myxococcales bacterium]|nr:tetratricopeptide repeat protein [Myxococcales bacterium]
SDLAWLRADVSLPPREAGPADQDLAVRRDLARVLALERTGRYDEALALAEGSLEAAQALGDRVVEAEAQAKLGTIRWRMADFAPAEQALRAGHFLAGRVAHDRVAYATARDLAWVVGVRLARPGEGRTWLEHARMNLARAGEDPERDPELLVMLGELEGAEGRLAEALAAHERALALREQALGAQHPEIADSLVNVGRLQAALGDARALATLERGRALAEATLGPAHPVVATADNELGVLLLGLGRGPEGIAALRQAIEIRERALGADDPGLASMLSNLAAAQAEHGEGEEAVVLLGR